MIYAFLDLSALRVFVVCTNKMRLVLINDMKLHISGNITINDCWVNGYMKLHISGNITINDC